MSSLAPTKRERPANTLPSRTGLLAWFAPLVSSTVGSKFIVALTGIALTGFVVIHMVGNLQLLLGREAINAYAKMLKSNAGLLWTARIGLLVLFTLHIVLALRLKRRSLAARPIGYAYEATAQATFASRYMVLTGLVILAFVIFHIAHYTLGIVHTANGKPYLELHDAQGRHDVYAMMIAGFSNPILAAIYLLAQVPLFLHLSHGVGSVFQTLGLNTPRTSGAVQCLARTVALVVCGGNVLIVAAVWSKIVA